MKIVKKVLGNSLVLVIHGRLDTITAPELENSIKNEVGGWEGAIADFTFLEYISSAGIRVLLSICKKYGSLEIRNANETIKEVLEITGTNNVFAIK